MIDEIECYGLRPASFVLVAGGSGQGKTTAVQKIIEQRNDLIPDLNLKKLVIVYSEHQQIYDQIAKSVGRDVQVELYENEIPTEKILDKNMWPYQIGGDSILIFDDVANDAFNNKETANLLIKLATTFCHHRYQFSQFKNNNRNNSSFSGESCVF